jgi:Zn-dependent alcohol dehydrogenase
VTAMFGTSAFAEYSLVHENQLVKVPKELPFPQAAILGCGTVTGAGAAINTAKVRPGDTVTVIGAGRVGLNVISGAKLAGAERIIAIDMQPKKEALARKFGATDSVNPASNLLDDRAHRNGSPTVVAPRFRSICLLRYRDCLYIVAEQGGDENIWKQTRRHHDCKHSLRWCC